MALFDNEPVIEELYVRHDDMLHRQFGLGIIPINIYHVCECGWYGMIPSSTTKCPRCKRAKIFDGEKLR